MLQIDTEKSGCDMTLVINEKFADHVDRKKHGG